MNLEKITPIDLSNAAQVLNFFDQHFDTEIQNEVALAQHVFQETIVNKHIDQLAPFLIVQRILEADESQKMNELGSDLVRDFVGEFSSDFFKAIGINHPELLQELEENELGENGIKVLGKMKLLEWFPFLDTCNRAYRLCPDIVEHCFKEGMQDALKLEGVIQTIAYGALEQIVGKVPSISTDDVYPDQLKKSKLQSKSDSLINKILKVMKNLQELRVVYDFFDKMVDEADEGKISTFNSPAFLEASKKTFKRLELKESDSIIQSYNTQMQDLAVAPEYKKREFFKRTSQALTLIKNKERIKGSAFIKELLSYLESAAFFDFLVNKVYLEKRKGNELATSQDLEAEVIQHVVKLFKEFGPFVERIHRASIEKLLASSYISTLRIEKARKYTI